MAGRMEDLLMGGSSSDDSDAEDNKSKSLATQVTATTTSTTTTNSTNTINNNKTPQIGAPPSKTTTTIAAAPPVATTAALQRSSSKSELTNRLKNLYSSPPGAVPPKINAPPIINPPPQSKQTQQVKVVNNRPSPTTAVQRPQQQQQQRRVSSIPSQPPKQQQQQKPPANNNYAPPHMVHTNHQQQQLQKPRGGPPPPQPIIQHQTNVGRVPAPLPKARTTNRSAPPTNRPVASVPVNSSMPTPTPNPMAPPPAPVVTTTQQQQQYGHAPHLRQSSVSSSQPPPAPPPHRHPSSSSRSSSNAVGIPPPNTHMHNAVPVDKRPASRSLSNSGGSQNLTDKEKKEKERFLMFTRVLMKYLEQRDADMHTKAKAQIKECYERNKARDPAFVSLTTSMKSRLRATVGDQYWKKAHDYLDHFLKQKMKEKGAGGTSSSSSSHQHRGGNVPPIINQPSSSSMQQTTHQQQQHITTQAQLAAAAAAKKFPIMQSPPSALPPEDPKVIAERKKAEEEARKKKERNAQARIKRAQKKKEKEAAAAVAKLAGIGSSGAHALSSVGHLPVGKGIAHTLPSPSVSSVQSGASSSKGKTTGSKAHDKKTASKAKDKKTTALRRSSSSSSITKKKEPAHKLMESVDWATLIDVKNLPSLFASSKVDVSLNEEQRMLLYGDDTQQAKIMDITSAASAALDTSSSSMDDANASLTEVPGVKPLPTKIPSVYNGWGTKNVLSVRNAWAKVRLPESEIQRAQEDKDEADKARAERPMGGGLEKVTKPPILSNTASPSSTELTIENDTQNHVWHDEIRAEQDPALALLSEATETFIKDTIKDAIGKARLRQNLDGVRLWNTLQAYSCVRNDDNMPPPPAFIRLGCDVRRQIALAEGNAAKIYQRMEEAIIRQNDTYMSTANTADIEEMLLESTSMGDLSKKPPLKLAAKKADEDAKRKFAIFAGSESMEPPLGRVPKQGVVTLQDIAVSEAGNRSSMIGSRRKRFRVGLKY